MKAGKTLSIVTVMLVLSSCNSQVAERDEKPPVSSIPTSHTQPYQEEGITDQEQIFQDTEKPKPAPQLSPEERERLIRGTEIEKSSSKENF